MGVKGIIRFQDDWHMGVFFLFWMFNWILQILKELFTRLIVWLLLLLLLLLLSLLLLLLNSKLSDPSNTGNGQIWTTQYKKIDRFL